MERFIVENLQYQAEHLRVRTLVLFGIEPTFQDRVLPPLEYLLDGYFSDIPEESFESDEADQLKVRMTYGSNNQLGNHGLVDSLRWRMADSLRAWKAGWKGIRWRHAARVEYRDALGKRFVQYFEDGVRVGASNWDRTAATADSLRRARKLLMFNTLTLDEAATQVANDCRSAIRSVMTTRR